MMELGDIFRRNLKIAVSHTGEPEAAVCRRAGVGKDLLRHFFNGKAQSMSVVRAAAIANALGVDLNRLTSPDFSSAELRGSFNLAEDAAEPWVPKGYESQANGAGNTFARLLAPKARTPETYKILSDHEAFGIRAGDVVVIDLGRNAQAEDLVLATVPRVDTGAHETVLRRFVPPYLIAANPMDNRPAILDDGTLPPFRPVVAVLRSKDL